MARSDSLADDLPQTQKNRPTRLYLPGFWIWNCILRVDKVLVDALKSALMIDPSPDSYRAKR
jgi:hypothetical protein